MASRMYSLKFPVLLCAAAVGIPTLLVALIGIPGVCGSVGGIFSSTIDAHPSLDFLFLISLGVIVLGVPSLIVGVIWFFYALIHNIHMERRVDPTQQLP